MTVPPDVWIRRMRRLEEVCRAGGLKLTHQRIEIFSELARTDEHLDAETIYRQVHGRMPAVSRDTVYRTLAMLEDRGLVIKANGSGPSRYDANTDPHHHFICRRCGAVRDFLSEAMDGLSPPADVQRWGVIESVRVQVRGICRECLAKDKHKSD